MVTLCMDLTLLLAVSPWAYTAGACLVLGLIFRNTGKDANSEAGTHFIATPRSVRSENRF